MRNDAEVATMANVWAHPADVSLLGQNQPTAGEGIDSDGEFLPELDSHRRVRSGFRVLMLLRMDCSLDPVHDDICAIYTHRTPDISCITDLN